MMTSFDVGVINKMNKEASFGMGIGALGGALVGGSVGALRNPGPISIPNVLYSGGLGLLGGGLFGGLIGGSIKENENIKANVINRANERYNNMDKWHRERYIKLNNEAEAIRDYHYSLLEADDINKILSTQNIG